MFLFSSLLARYRTLKFLELSDWITSTNVFIPGTQGHMAYLELEQSIPLDETNGSKFQRILPEKGRTVQQRRHREYSNENDGNSRNNINCASTYLFISEF